MKRINNIFGVIECSAKRFTLFLLAISLGFFFACTKDIEDDMPKHLLTVNRTAGAGFATAAWKSGSATWVQLVSGVRVHDRATVTLTAEPQNPAHTAIWNGAIVGTNLSVTMDQAHAISVAFDTLPPSMYILTIEPSNAASVYLDRDYTIQFSDFSQVIEGTRLYLKFNKIADKRISTVTGVDEGSLSEDMMTATVTMTANKTIKVTYVDIEYFALTLPSDKLVTAFIDEAHTEPASNFEKIEYGTKYYLAISTPKEQFVDQVKGIDAGSLSPDKTKATVTMTADKIIEVTYSDVQYFTLTFISEGEIKAYTDEDRKQKVSDLTRILPETKIYLTIPKISDKFIHEVEGIDENSLSPDKTQATVTMTDNKAVKVTYSEVPYVVLTLPNDGSVRAYINDERTEPVPNLTKITPGTKIFLTITVPDEMIVSAVDGIDVGSLEDNGATATATITMDKDKEVIPVFESNPKLFITIPIDMDGDGNNDALSVIGYTGKQTTVKIPAQLEGQPVRQVGYPTGTAAQNHQFSLKIVGITLPSSVTVIGAYAFKGCASISSFTVPSTVTTIGEFAFSGCASLINITIAPGVQFIYKNAFENCLFTSISLPLSLTSLGENAFNACKSLRNIEMPYVDGISSALQGTTNITLEIISSGNDLRNTFYNCTTLKAIVIAPNITSMPDGLFEGCTNLRQVTMPSLPAGSNKSMGTIIAGAPEGQIDFYINNNPIEIGSFALPITGTGGGLPLKRITIPASAREFGYRALRYATNLQEVVIEVTNPTNEFFTDLPASVTSIKVPPASVEAYRNHTGWETYKAMISGY
ncbi:MAG: leucine-rich repeat domain-containing protein [Bacteroidales bacterium]